MLNVKINNVINIYVQTFFIYSLKYEIFWSSLDSTLLDFYVQFNDIVNLYM